jgi:hypothetical protein
MDNYYLSTRQGKYKYAGVPVYISTQIKDRETCIFLISQLEKQNYMIPLHIRSVAC